MTRIDRRGSRILDGVETAVAAARVAMSSATRSAFRRGLAQMSPPPPPDFPSALASSSPPAHTGRPDPLPSPLPLSAARARSNRGPRRTPSRGLRTARTHPKQPSTMQRPTPLRAAPLSADACGPDGLRPAHPHQHKEERC